MENNAVEISQRTSDLPRAQFLCRALRAVLMWLATHQVHFAPPKAFHRTDENFTSEQCMSSYGNLANWRRIF